MEGFFQTTPEGRYLRANPALARIYGYDSVQELMSAMTDLNLQLYVDPNRRKDFTRHMQEAGEVIDFESQVFRRDRSVIWISENARLVRDESGEPILYEGTVQDITARKKAEEALRASEMTWRCLVENSGDLIFVADDKGKVFFSNRVESENSHETVYADLQDFVSPDSRQALRDVTERVFDTGTVEHFELEEHSGGQKSWYESRAIPIEIDDKVCGVLIIGTETTDQRKREDELRSSQRFIERVAHASPNIIYVYDLTHHRYIYANERLLKVLGYMVGEIFEMGSDFLKKFSHPEDASLLEERFKKFSEARDDEVFECEFRLRHRRGDWRWINARETIFTRTSSGQPDCVIGTAQDVTERRRTETALLQSEERFENWSRASTSSRGKGESAAIVLHTLVLRL